MSLADFLTSWTAIISAAFLSATFMYLFLFKFKELLDWEAEHIWKRIFKLCFRIRLLVAKWLKSNERFMRWLNEPQEHNTSDKDIAAMPVKVRYDWKH